MTIKTIRFSKMLVRILLFVLFLTACNSQVTIEPTNVPPRTNIATFTITATSTEKPKPTAIPTVGTKPRNTPTPTKTPTLAPTMDSTEQVWYSTAVAINETARAESWAERSLTQSVEATQIAQFPVACDGSSSVSPNGKWLATSCGYKRDQTLVVQSNGGAKWVLDFVDFLNPATPKDIMGALYPIFWSPDGAYLYFATSLGYDGGGNQCFSGIGVYGLFRLNLKTGTWITQIPSTDGFAGYNIKFSPTGRRYAADINGITITDLKTGEVIRLDVSGVMDLIWSPDGQYLAFSVASCGEQFVESSSVFVWDSSTNQTQLLFTTNENLLRPESWVDALTLKISGEKYLDMDTLYTIYTYNIPQASIIFTGTATPRP